MKRAGVCGLVVAGVLGVGIPAVMAAEEGATALPTLLIKGDVVSIDAAADAAAPLLKVKDRYGFETPIYLGPATKISQGDQAVDAASLAPGTTVEVEYNFDINPAKRHAVSVKVGTEAAAASAVSTPEAPAADEAEAGVDVEVEPPAPEPAIAPADPDAPPAQ